MWNRKLCLGTLYGELPASEQLPLIAAAGFDAFFTGWNQGSPTIFANQGSALGLTYQSVHAPFDRIEDLWKEGPEGDSFVEILLDCIRGTAEAGVPILVSHAFKGFTEHTPTQIGIDRFGKLVRKAAEYGLTLAFENTEGEEYLAALMNAFRNEKYVGFCLDTGHEMCYNHSQDMIALYGDRLVCTHINDNLGILSYEGETTPRDDLHLLPYDGIGDWERFGQRMHRIGYNGILTFELTRHSKQGRHDNDGYAAMTFEFYLAEAFKRACRVAVKC